MKDSVFYWIAGVLEALVLAPLLPGIINRVKAFFAGRKGPSLFQLYFDLFKLMQKPPVYSAATGLLFRIAPLVTLLSAFGMLLLLPGAGAGSPLGFAGDVLLFLYLGGLGRMFTVYGAMDTGSSFEGMGASRECQFAILSEGAFMASAGAMILCTGKFSLQGLLNGMTLTDWNSRGMALLLLAVAVFIVVLTECCRLPVDDPETHLELTMIHEAMILDSSGQDLGIIHYAASLKMWILLLWETALFLPSGGPSLTTLLLQTGTVFLLCLVIGTVESVTARYRFLKVPQLLTGSMALGIMAMVLLHLAKGA